MTANDLRQYIRDVPDFPKPGILFKDITPLLRSPEALEAAVQGLADPYRDQRISNIVAIESRGFIFGSCVARILGAGFVPIRKPGKLPWTTRRNEYKLEYGTDVIEIHDDALTADDRVVITVADSGTGMSPDERAHAFERFYKGDGEDGFGLGLAIARQAVVASGGAIEIESEPNVGTTVWVEVPAYAEARSA